MGCNSNSSFIKRDCFAYDSANKSFGWSTLCPIFCAIACWNDAAYEWSYFLKSPWTSATSSAYFLKSYSACSAPKNKSVTPSELNAFTPPNAKRSAGCMQAATGTSMTKSAPFCNASPALVHLSKHAGSPRWRKFPLIATTNGASLSSFLICSIW